MMNILKCNHRNFSCNTYVGLVLNKNNSKVDKSDVWNAEIPSAAKRSVCGATVHTLELSAPPPNRVKKTLFNLVNSLMNFQTNTYVAAKKLSHCETVALWNSLVTWKLAQYLCDVTGSPTVNQVKSALMSVLLMPFVRHVHLHENSWFGRIPSAVANR